MDPPPFGEADYVHGLFQFTRCSHQRPTNLFESTSVSDASLGDDVHSRSRFGMARSEGQAAAQDQHGRR